MAERVLNLASFRRGSEEYKYMSSVIAEIKQTQNKITINESLLAMKRILNRVFGVEFKITIVDNNNSSVFFGAHIYPDHKICTEINDLILEEDKNEIEAIRNIWKESTLWYLDLDSKVFYDTSLNLNPDDIITLIVYTIDKIIFRFEVVEKVNYFINKTLFDQNYSNNKLARSSVCRSLFIIPFIEYCQFTEFSTKLPDDCLISDSNGQALCSKQAYDALLMKIVCAYGNSLIDINPEEKIIVIKNILEWVLTCVSELKYSSRFLKTSLEKKIIATNSYYCKNILINIYLNFGTYNDNNLIKESIQPGDFYYNQVVKMGVKVNPLMMKNMEKQKDYTVKQAALKVLTESFQDLMDKMGFMKKVSQKEIDTLRIEAGAIKTYDDKLYVLDMLYDKIAIVDTSLDMMKSKDTSAKVKTSETTLKDQKKQLSEIRDQIIKKDLESKEFKLWVKYPSGYEG